ncbi:alpha/beta fold hydrolase [Hymenobacter terricola]|uniref:alpha/beta fold hydrolase n=1 Tax=Hymenobacter terricola TaxID=2819236 RepID=UPI001B300EDD|nr:alpha/beta hydrolase [Hymenobacter terricola]
MPTLVIHGDEDQNAPIANSGARTAKSIPGAQYQVYEGEPNGLFFTAKDKLSRDLLAFIGK